MIEWIYKPKDLCPVQAEGKFMGVYFYFRSRGLYATIEFSPYSMNERCLQSERGAFNNVIARFRLWTWKEMYDAGYANHKFCLLLCYLGCIKYWLNLNFNMCKTVER